MKLADYLRDVPDFPAPGIMFKDISPLLADHGAFPSAVEAMAAPFEDQGIPGVVGIEARGIRVLVELVALKGRAKLPDVRISAPIEVN